jgi:hypothetical protein
MYDLCNEYNVCSFNGTNWSKEELVQLVYSIGIACDASLGQENNFTVYDQKEEFRSVFTRIWDDEGHIPMQDNVNDTLFRDKIIPFIRNVSKVFVTLLLEMKFEHF